MNTNKAKLPVTTLAANSFAAVNGPVWDISKPLESQIPPAEQESEKIQDMAQKRSDATKRSDDPTYGIDKVIAQM